MSTYDEISVTKSISPLVRTDGTVNGTSVDTVVSGGMQDAVLLVTSGAVTDGSHAVTVEESADGSTGWAAVAADRLQGDLPTVESADDDTVFMTGVRPSQRYLRAVMVTTGATTGAAISAAFILGRPRTKPVSH
ncbi:hypothetical protein [Actinomadura sediminis]|uniref:Uncharacterized protein n=1 Tax=Actinomadura sediminis TaxID=1038904 RepID=A0ABW3ETW9_9ACTN